MFALCLLIENQLVKLEAAKAAYLWLPLDTFGYLWIPLVTFGYLWLPLVSFPKYSHFFFTNHRSDNSLTSQNNISICFVHTFACRERYKNIFNFIIKRSEYFKAHYFVLKLSSSEPRPRVTGIGISIFNLTQARIVDGGIVYSQFIGMCNVLY